MSEEGIKKAEERLKENERRSRRTHVSLTTIINKKPGRHYAFVRNNSQDVVQAELDGYSSVKESENPGMRVPAATVSPEGAFEVGDTVLMEIPQELKDRNLEEEVAARDEFLRRIEGEFRSEIGRAAREAGVKRDLALKEGENELGEAFEKNRAQSVGKVSVAMGATFDKQGNLVK